MRSTIFNALYVTVSAGFVFALAPLSLLPGTGAIRAAARLYAKSILFLMRHVAGIKVEIKGADRLPQGPFLIAAKHQSWGDGYAMVSYFDDLTFVAGDHLEKFPLVANILQKLGAIVVDNCGGHKARKRLADSFLVAAEEKRPVLIYPEGHLSKVGEHHAYRSGVWHMQQACGWPVVPVATNLGLFWSQQDAHKEPGTATNEFLDPIPAGLSKDEFMARLEAACETGTARLVAQVRGGEPHVSTLVDFAGVKTAAKEPVAEVVGA
jgi:1-acyl-sn-glycerol-3-phosphate acyltransferase